MNFYYISTSMLVSGGSASLVSLRIPGGLCHQVFVQAHTSSTAFKFNITNANSRKIRTYGIHKGEFNDTNVFPLKGINTLNITNASATDTFDVELLVRDQ